MSDAPHHPVLDALLDDYLYAANKAEAAGWKSMKPDNRDAAAAAYTDAVEARSRARAAIHQYVNGLIGHPTGPRCGECLCGHTAEDHRYDAGGRFQTPRRRCKVTGCACTHWHAASPGARPEEGR